MGAWLCRQTGGRFWGPPFFSGNTAKSWQKDSKQKTPEGNDVISFPSRRLRLPIQRLVTARSDPAGCARVVPGGGEAGSTQHQVRTKTAVSIRINNIQTLNCQFYRRSSVNGNQKAGPRRSVVGRTVVLRRFMQLPKRLRF